MMTAQTKARIPWYLTAGAVLVGALVSLQSLGWFPPISDADAKIAHADIREDCKIMVTNSVERAIAEHKPILDRIDAMQKHTDKQADQISAMQKQLWRAIGKMDR